MNHYCFAQIKSNCVFIVFCIFYIHIYDMNFHWRKEWMKVRWLSDPSRWRWYSCHSAHAYFRFSPADCLKSYWRNNFLENITFNSLNYVSLDHFRTYSDVVIEFRKGKSVKFGNFVQLEGYWTLNINSTSTRPYFVCYNNCNPSCNPKTHVNFWCYQCLKSFWSAEELIYIKHNLYIFLYERVQ